MSKEIISILLSYVLVALPIGIVVGMFMKGRPHLNLKKEMCKVGVISVFLCVLLTVSVLQHNYYLDLQEPESVEDEDLDLRSIELMTEKYDSVSEYTFYDHGEDIIYTVPNPYPECPFTLKGLNANNEVVEVVIEDYEQLPVLLDTVWYWYGTQNLSTEYYMLTFGELLSEEKGQSQTFFMFDPDGKLLNIYTANLPIEEEGVTMDTFWIFPISSLCAALLWLTVRNVVIFIHVMKNRKKAEPVKKGGRRHEIKG